MERAPRRRGRRHGSLCARSRGALRPRQLTGPRRPIGRLAAALASPSFGWIALSTISVQAAQYAVRPMVSYRALEIGAGTAGVGIVAASFSLLPLLVATSVGRWIDIAGERRAGVLGGALMVASTALLVPARSLWALFLLNAVFGLGQLLSIVAQQSLIANRSLPGGHTAGYARYTVFSSVGQLIGPVAIGVAAGRAAAGSAAGGPGGDVTSALLVGSVISAGALVAGFGFGSPAGRPAAHERLPLRSALSVPGMAPAMITSLSVAAAVDLFQAYLPAWGTDRGVPVTVVAALLALRSAVSLASRIGLGTLVVRLGQRGVLTLSTAAAAVSVAILPFADTPVAFVAVAGIGFGLGLGQPLTMAWVASLAQVGQRATAMALRITGNRLGQVVVPGAAGIVAGLSSVGAVFLLLAGMLAMTAAFSSRVPDYAPVREPVDPAT